MSVPNKVRMSKAEHKSATTNGTLDTTKIKQLKVLVPDTYTVDDENKVVRNRQFISVIDTSSEGL